MQLKVLLHARFILITVLYERLYAPLEKVVFAKTQKYLSLIKFMKFISRNLKSFVKQFVDNHREEAIQRVERYCTFDKRNRKIFNQIMAECLNEN